jgi:di/tricarboxylate transporter
MTIEILFVTLILLATLALLISERLPYDLTAIGIMVALMIAGILTPREAVAGFANPAPLTVGALFIVTKGLIRTGGLLFLTRLLAATTKGRPRRILIVCLLLVGVLSAFVNNTPVVVLMLSVILGLSGRFDISPARFLMPISFISILAGTTTLIGTSTNIIVSDLAVSAGLAPIGMFELARVGGLTALMGGALLFLLSDRLLPRTHTPIFHTGRSERHRYIAELAIPADSPHIGREVRAALHPDHPAMEVHEVLRGAQVRYPETDDCTLAAGDMILVSATAAELVEMLGHGTVTLPKARGDALPKPYDLDTQIVEVIVPPESRLLGRRLANTRLGRDDDLYVLGIQRRRVHYTERRMTGLRLQVGDILLVQSRERGLKRLRAGFDLVIVEDTVPRVINRTRAPVALAIFVAMVAAATFGVFNILTAALAAAFLLVVTGCLSMHEAYKAIDVPVLMLIIGTIALGAAMTACGAADLYARGFLSLFHGAGPHAVLAAFIVLTSLLSHVLSNNSTAVLLVPIGIATAGALGVDPRPFVVGICFGASACFATPIGYQTNLLVYGPGGYRFTDFLRLGMVLNVVVWVTAALLVPRFWSF